MELASGK